MIVGDSIEYMQTLIHRDDLKRWVAVELGRQHFVDPDEGRIKSLLSHSRTPGSPVQNTQKATAKCDDFGIGIVVDVIDRQRPHESVTGDVEIRRLQLMAGPIRNM